MRWTWGWAVFLFGAFTGSACDMPSLPLSHSYFFAAGHSEASGKFLLENETVWELLITEVSWFRLTLDPKFAAVSVSLNQNETPLATSACPNLGTATIAKKVFPGTYQLQITSIPDLSLPDSNIYACASPFVYLNTAVHLYAKLFELRISDLTNEFPDLTEANKAISENLAFSSTFASNSIGIARLLDPIIKSYPITIPQPDKNPGKGYTGLWDLTFSIRNS